MLANTWPQPLLSAALARPQHPAVTTSDGQTLHYGTLLREVQSCAAQMHAWGLGAGSMVAMPAASVDLAWFVGFHALMWLGAVPVLLPDMEALYTAQIPVEAIWGEGPLLDIALDMQPSPHAPVGAALRGERFCEGASVALMLLTSGSEGKPKVVSLTHTQIMANVLGATIRLGHRLDDRWLLGLPLYHMGGLSVLLRAVVLQISVVGFGGGFDLARWTQALLAGDVSMLSAVPVMLDRLLDAWDAPEPPQGLRVVLLGGAALDPALRARAQKMRWPIVETFGMTEAASQIATGFVGATRPKGAAENAVGPPMPFVRIATHADGRLHLRGPVAPEGAWQTSDVGAVDARGWICVHGRADDMIISGGQNVAPAEIERALCRCEGVASAVVFGVPSKTFGMRPVAAVMLSPIGEEGQGQDFCDDFCDAQLKKELEPFLARWKIPDVLWLWPKSDWPRTAVGKIARKTVKALWFQKTQNAAKSPERGIG